MAKIMVVDDSTLARRMLKPILLGAGHKVVCEATNGAEAVQCYPEYLPDVVMMDITMPGEDGIAAAKRIRADFPNARIVMLTAMSDDQHVMEALESGAAHYIIKPYKGDKVLRVLDQVLAGIKNERSPQPPAVL
jgi:two-component system, chemotaxis family, chemotaxis protein CheY